MDGPVNCAPGDRALVVLVACILVLGCIGCRPDREAALPGGSATPIRVTYRELFTAADTNQDGFLSVPEFAGSHPPDHSAKETEKEFSNADKDRDQRVTYDEFVSTFHKPHRLLWFLGIFSLVSFVGSLIAIPIVVARLPVDHFVAPHEAADWVASSIARRLWLVLKNLLGILLIAGGIMMLVLPGQGVLTILLGVAVMDLPGKWKAMRALARRPEVMKALNWMRQRADKPPLIPPPPKGDTHHDLPQVPPTQAAGEG
jgi:hypothetical protein